MVSPEKNNKQRLEELTTSLSLPKAQVIKMLLDIYDLENTSAYVSHIQRMRNSGLSAKKLNDLSILFSFLAKVFEPYTEK